MGDSLYSNKRGSTEGDPMSHLTTGDPLSLGQLTTIGSQRESQGPSSGALGEQTKEGMLARLTNKLRDTSVRPKSFFRKADTGIT